MVYVTHSGYLEGVSSIKKWSGLILRRGWCTFMDACAQLESIFVVSRKHGLRNPSSYTPDMSSLCFSTEDIPTGPDKTLRTVGPAGTVLASSTGMLTHACVNLCIFIAWFSTWALRAQGFSGCTDECITLSFWITSVLEVYCCGLVGSSFCSMWQPRWMQHFWLWPLIASSLLQVWSISAVVRDVLKRLCEEKEKESPFLCLRLNWKTNQKSLT